MERILLKKARCLLSLLLFLFSLTTSLAQTGAVKGRVTDEKGEGLPGVTVLVKGTTNGTSTDLQGNYSLNADGNSTLVTSYIGFESQELEYLNKNTFYFHLKMFSCQ